MARLILLVVLVLAASYLIEAGVRHLRRALGDPRGPADRGPAIRDAGSEADFRPHRNATPAPGDRLVACQLCGVHTPTSRAFWLRKVGPFCSETCRQRAKSVS